MGPGERLTRHVQDPTGGVPVAMDGKVDKSASSGLADIVNRIC